MTFSPPEGDPIEAISEVSQSVSPGRFVSIVGPSGCGKSTLLACVGGLVRPTRGRILLGGEEVTGPDARVGIVFQEESTLPWRSVYDNVRFGLELAGVGREAQRERTQAMIDLVGLRGFEKTRPAALSGGMRQRVAIARTLALDPELLLMDEPFGALDQQTRLLLGEELLRIWTRTNKTVLFVTHDIQEAVLLSQEIWVMSYRPSVIMERVEVGLEYPRSLETVSTHAFNEVSNRVWHLIQGEAKRAFMRE